MISEDCSIIPIGVSFSGSMVMPWKVCGLMVSGLALPASSV